MIALKFMELAFPQFIDTQAHIQLKKQNINITRPPNILMYLMLWIEQRHCDMTII